MSEWIWISTGRTKGMRHEANIRDEGIPVHVVFNYLSRAQIFKLLRSPRIDSKESSTPAYVAWRAGKTTLFLLGSEPP